MTKWKAKKRNREEMIKGEQGYGEGKQKNNQRHSWRDSIHEKKKENFLFFDGKRWLSPFSLRETHNQNKC